MSASARKTVVVVGSYAPSLVGFRGPLLAEMASRGHRVIAVAPDIDPAQSAQLAALGVESRSLPLARTAMNPVEDLAYLLRLRNLFRSLRPDVVLTYTIKPVIWGGAAARLAGVPTRAALITGLGLAFAGGGGLGRAVVRWIVTALYRLTLRGNQVVFFQNPDDQAEFIERGLARDPQCKLVNGSGVDLEQYDSRPVPGQLNFLMVARLLGEKGVREYAAAGARLKRRWPSAAFRLVGWLDTSPNSISQAELDAFQRDGVEFLGRLEDVRPALADAAVFVLPSYYREGVPRSALEAMAMGRAIITTDAPGCRETVRPGENGILIKPRDVDDLERAMERFITEPGLAKRMGASSRRYAEERFDVRKVNAVMLKALGLAE